MNKTVLLLGLPAVGKSTFSSRLKQQLPEMRQFSVRLFTQQLMKTDTPLGRYLLENNIARPKEYMPDPVVEQIFAAFLDTVAQNAFLLIEGFPINREQYYGMERQLLRVGRTLDAVFVLEDDMDLIRHRQSNRKVCLACELKNGAGLPILPEHQVCPYCGGPLQRRPEDDPDFFEKRCRKFQDELAFISGHISSEYLHRITVSKADPVEYVTTWLRTHTSPSETGK